ncbi:MAG: HAD family phosphatase [candidate division WOR-3 bacterium]
MNKACFFDLDGTLIPNPSSEVRVLRVLFKNFVISPSGIVMWFLESIFRYKNFKNSKAYYQGLQVDTIRTLVNKKLKNLRGFVCTDALEYIKKKQNEGYKIYLISGTPHFIAEAISKNIEFSKVYSSELEIRKGKFTGRIVSIIPFGKNKETIVKEIAKKDPIDLKESIAFGDSYFDLPFLLSTGSYFAVNPDKKLRRLVKPEQIIIWRD